MEEKIIYTAEQMRSIRGNNYKKRVSEQLGRINEALKKASESGICDHIYFHERIYCEVGGMLLAAGYKVKTIDADSFRISWNIRE